MESPETPGRFSSRCTSASHSRCVGTRQRTASISVLSGSSRRPKRRRVDWLAWFADWVSTTSNCDAASSREASAGLDRSDVRCPHSTGCPLFPLLNGSIRGWRDHYCDHEIGWRECARYEEATRGRPVPITLLPNGANAQHFRGITRPRTQRPEPIYDTAHGHAKAWFEPAPAGTPSAGRVPHCGPPAAATSQQEPTAGRWTPVSTAPAAHVRAPAPDCLDPVRQVGAVHAFDRPEPPARTVLPARRRWWTRLADWIAGPA
jgi:hypothetical protein